MNKGIPKYLNDTKEAIIVRELRSVLKQYDKWYQKKSAEIGETRETPHTLFHEIIEKKIERNIKILHSI